MSNDKIKLWHGRALFYCPGCDGKHQVLIDDGTSGWTFNGNLEQPTFKPSILVQHKKMTDKGNADYQAWLDAGHKELPDGFEFDSVPHVCHSFVTDGRIQFLSDCTHSMAGQTVDLPDWGD